MTTIAGRIILLTVISALALAHASTTARSAQEPQDRAASIGAGPAGDPESWPREARSGERTFRVHQPQFESWDGSRLEAYAAIEVSTQGSDKPFYGMAWITARTSVYKTDRMVTLEDIKIAKVVFPAAIDKEEVYLQILQNSIVRKVQQISLDRFEAGLAIMEAGHKIAALPLQNDPPEIIFSVKPAMLVPVDGTPAYRPMRGANFSRVINTRPLIVRDPKGKFYLHLFDGWMESGAFFGPWTVCKKPPKVLEMAKTDGVATGMVDLLEGKADPEKKAEAPSLAKGPPPLIYIRTVPAELIVTEGEPRYVAIEGTALSYVENTTGNIFRHATEQKIYVLISGRWFQSSSTAGPWEFVPGGKLPPSFANIPDDSPKENVKASVPGTPQAMEAVIANQIPEMATVSRKNAQLDPPQFDGDMVLQPIEGTPLQYAANTTTPLIRTGNGAFYAVEHGVWFKASSAKGPWEIADSVPAEIYSIPPSSRLHPVSYVRIYGADAETVTYGYTPGYFGTCVTRGSGYVVVYGTGYTYTPWIGAVWYGAPVTYGFGSAVYYTPWTGWAYGFGFGWSWGYPMHPTGWGWGPYPWWGPIGWAYYYPFPYYRPPHYYGGAAWGPLGAAAWGPGVWAATTNNIYHRWGDATAVTRTSGGFNAWTGNQWASQVGMAYNSKTGNLAAGQRAAVGNVYTGDYAYGRRGIITDTDTGQTVSGGRAAGGNASSGAGGSMSWVRGEDAGIARIGNDIYAGKDGAVYRRSESGWEQYSGDGWRQVERPVSGGRQPSDDRREHARARTASGSPQSYLDTLNSLDRQHAARSVGERRTQGYRTGAYRGTAGARRR